MICAQQVYLTGKKLEEKALQEKYQPATAISSSWYLLSPKCSRRWELPCSRGKILHKARGAASRFLQRRLFPPTTEFLHLLFIWSSAMQPGSPTRSVCQPQLLLTRSHQRTGYLKTLNRKRVSSVTPCYHNPETMLLKVYGHANEASSKTRSCQILMGSMR